MADGWWLVAGDRGLCVWLGSIFSDGNWGAVAGESWRIVAGVHSR
jgi:hypothetical protein